MLSHRCSAKGGIWGLSLLLQSPGNSGSRSLSSGFIRFFIFSRAYRGPPLPPADMILPGSPLASRGSLTNSLSGLSLPVLPMQCPPQLRSNYFWDIDHSSLSCSLHLALLHNPSSTQGPICPLFAQESSAFSSVSITCCAVESSLQIRTTSFWVSATCKIHPLFQLDGKLLWRKLCSILLIHAHTYACTPLYFIHQFFIEPHLGLAESCAK